MMTLTELLNMYKNLLESDEPEDDEMMSSPHRSFSNPFDAKPAGKVAGPTTSTPMSVATSKKPDQKYSAPSGVRKNDFDASSPTAPKKTAPSMKPNMPQYPGSFVGQQWNPGGTYGSKVSQFKVNPTGPADDGWRRKSNTVLNKGTGVAWNGKEWVPQAEFDAAVAMKPGSSAGIANVFTRKK